MNGWMKLYNKTLSWGWFTDVPTAHLWIYLLLKAYWMDGEYRGMKIEKGSFPITTIQMASETGLTEKQVRLALKKLEKTGEIIIKRTNKFSVISVVKWAEYQGEAVDEDRQKDTQRCIQRDSQREEQRADLLLDEDYKTNRHKDIYNGKTKKKSFTPPTLADVEEYCRQRNSSVDPKRFYEYFDAGNWADSKGNKVKNWKQKLITWENNTRVERDNTVPIYSTAGNTSMSKDEEKELLALMGKA